MSKSVFCHATARLYRVVIDHTIQSCGSGAHFIGCAVCRMARGRKKKRVNCFYWFTRFI